VQDLLSYQDVFAFGIGLDIAGAFLLAKGLLLSTRQILSLSTPHYGWSPPEVLARVDDRVSTEIGVSALALGFACQLIGYFVGSLFNSSSSPSAGRGGAIVALAFLAIVWVWLTYRIVLPPRRRRLLIGAARYDNHGGKHEYPFGAHLLALGINMPPRTQDESETDYAKRVWRVDRIIEGSPTHD
jgi:hypothetical protein